MLCGCADIVGPCPRHHAIAKGPTPTPLEQLEIERDHWKAEALRVEAEANERIDRVNAQLNLAAAVREECARLRAKVREVEQALAAARAEVARLTPLVVAKMRGQAAAEVGNDGKDRFQLLELE